MDMEEATEEMDKVDKLRMEDFSRLEAFYSIHQNFPVSEYEVSLNVFRFFKGRHMILEANFLPIR